MTMGHQAAVDWLLGSEEPAVRFLARRDLLGEVAAEDASKIMSGPKVTALLSGQRDDGAFRGEPGIIRRYRGSSRRPEEVIGVDQVPAGVAGGWRSTQWRLVSLVELAVPPGEPRAVAAANYLLSDILDRRHNGFRPRIINGLPRICVNAEGAALVIGSRLGMAADPRMQRMSEALLEWQWPDGGWNCDQKASGRRSSFHETFVPAWGLHEYAVATDADWAGMAAERAAELFLEHRVFRSLRTGKPINKQWLDFHYPPYWHYDVLQALVVLGRLGKLDDPRADDALDLVAERRRPDGLWESGGYWWQRPGSKKLPEVVDWGRRGPNEMITLNGLRVLRWAGRLD
jgi:hypothetical protein